MTTTYRPDLTTLAWSVGAVLYSAVISPTCCTAQDTRADTVADTATGIRGGSGITVGVVGLSTDRLNRALEANGLPRQASTALTVGYGAYSRFGRLIVGASGHGALGRTTEDAGWRSRTGGGYGVVDLGYAVIATRRVTVAVLGGLGGSKLTTRLQRPQTRDFTAVLGDPRVSLDLSGQSWLWHAGIKAELATPGKAAAQARLISFEAGFITRLGDRTNWRSDGDVVRNGPIASIGGAYLRVSLGSAAKRRRDGLVPAILSVLPFTGN